MVRRLSRIALSALLFGSPMALFPLGRSEASQSPERATLPLSSEAAEAATGRESAPPRTVSSPSDPRGRRFEPIEEHREIWAELDRLDPVSAVVVLERVARHPGITPEERKLALVELGERCYALRLFDRAYGFLSQIADEDLPPVARLRLAELGSYYQGWSPARTLRALARIEPSELNARDRELRRLLLSRSLWRRLDPIQEGLTESSLSALALDGEDVWGGTWNGGIFRYTPSSGEVRVFRAGQYRLTPNAITSIHVDRFGVWFAGLDGIQRYNKVTGAWSRIDFPDEIQPERIQRFARHLGTLYLATVGHGLWRYTDSTWERVPQSRVGLNINGLFPRDEETVWIATRDRGLFVWRPATDEVQSLGGEPGGPTNVTAVVELEHDVWVGTYGEGLYRYDTVRRQWRRYRQANGEIPDDWVMSLAVQEGRLFVGTFGGGVVVWRDRTSFQALRDLGSPMDVVAMVPYRERLYLATLRDGLWILDVEGLDAIPR